METIHCIASRLELRILIIIMIIMTSIAWSRALPVSDFAQDYLAARASLGGVDPNTPSLLLAHRYGVPDHLLTSVQTAHPPLVTLLALPFATLPWGPAHFLWELCLAITVGILIMLARVRVLDLVLLSPAWIFGLALGNLDGIVISLCLIALQTYPSLMIGVALGLGAALKVYPVFLILGFALVRQYRVSILALLTGGVATLVAISVLGFESLIGWIYFIPKNTDIFAANMFNLSLSKIVVPLGGSPLLPLVLALSMAILQARQNRIKPWLPTIVLTTPTIWLQALPLLSGLLNLIELIGVSFCSILILVSWYFGSTAGGLIGPGASLVLMAILIRVYWRLCFDQK